MFSSVIGLLTAVSMSITGASSESNYDEYGGWRSLTGGRTGYFHVKQIDGVWWLVDPEGYVFISRGVNHISFTADHAPTLGYSPYGRVTAEKYGDASSWAVQAIQNLRDWGFNTVGAWSSQETFTQKMPYTMILGLGAITGADWQKGKFPDVFSEEFRRLVGEKARELCAPNADDPYLIGYFTDNELRWGRDWRSSNTLFDDFLAMPEGPEGKTVLVNMLKEIYGDIDKLNAAWNVSCSSFDDILAVRRLSDLGAEMASVESELAAGGSLKVALPKDLAIMYLNQIYGGLDKANEAFNTNAKSYDELLTPQFLSLLAKQVKIRLPREAIVIGLSMFYESLDKANEVFGTDAKSYEELLDRIFELQSLSPVATEIKRVQSEFLKTVAEQYFRVCREAIRKADGNHLILGCRFAGYAPAEVVEGMKDYVDVVSYNNYDKLPPEDRLKEIYGIAGKPIMITEFSFKAMDSGLPNTRGAGRPVETQEDRARHFEQYVTRLMALPYAVGFHWFEYADEPAEGRFDGENSNYGLVDIKDEPWKVLVGKMSEVNREVESIHRGG